MSSWRPLSPCRNVQSISGKMKLLAFVLVCLPIIMAEERAHLDLTALRHLFNTDILRNDLQTLVDIVGSDATEAFCESKCIPMIQHADHTHILVHACPLICRSLQQLISKLHLSQDSHPVQTLKRTILGNLFGGFDTAQLAHLLQTLVDILGSDPTIQMIENECHVLMKHPVLDSGCGFIAHGFQSLLHAMHIEPKPHTRGAVVNERRARSIIDTILHTLGLNIAQLKADAQQMLDLLGSDATEQMMEAYCHERISHHQGLIDHACALVAHGLQYLIQQLHLVPDPGTPGAGGGVVG